MCVQWNELGLVVASTTLTLVFGAWILLFLNKNLLFFLCVSEHIARIVVTGTEGSVQEVPKKSNYSKRATRNVPFFYSEKAFFLVLRPTKRPHENYQANWGAPTQHLKRPIPICHFRHRFMMFPQLGAHPPPPTLF